VRQYFSIRSPSCASEESIHPDFFHDLLLTNLFECDFWIARTCFQSQNPSCVNWDLATTISYQKKQWSQPFDGEKQSQERITTSLFRFRHSNITGIDFRPTFCIANLASTQYILIIIIKLLLCYCYIIISIAFPVS